MDVKVDMPVTEKAKLSVKNLNFYYGSFHALKNINLDIPENKVTAFIGPSGCGKSTLLRTLNRMFELYPEQRAEGQILLDGEDILTSKEDVSLIRAKVGMVFQKPTPFPMSIYDNIAFGVKLFERLSRSEMDDRVEWALTKAALWNEVKDKLNQTIVVENVGAAAGTLHGARDGQHLTHAGSGLRAFVANDDHRVGLDLIRQDGRHRGVLTVKDASRSIKEQLVDAGNLDHRALRRKGAGQDGQSPAVVNGIGQRVHHIAIWSGDGKLRKVLGHGLSRHGENVTVEQTGVEEML